MNIEGRNAVAELIKSETTIDKITAQKNLTDAASLRLLNEIKRKGVKLTFADKDVMDKLSSTKRHQGFIAQVSDFVYAELEEITASAEEKTNSLVIILDGIEDPHNLGSIIRVAECCGADGVIIGKHRSASVTDTVMRVSEGSANHVKIARVTNISAALEQLKQKGFWIYALELGGDDIYKTNLTGKTALVVGGEDSGVKKLTEKNCDKTVTIPLYGKINSLNASVAAGVAAFEIMRQRNK